MSRINECGHPEREHVARGMCNACYQRMQWRTRPGMKEHAREKLRARRANDTDKIRRDNLRRKFKMTLQEYDDMYERQGGVCCICGRKCQSGARLAVDHDHTTGKIRGLLCMFCNRSIGMLNDDPVLVRKVAEYLELHSRENNNE